MVPCPERVLLRSPTVAVTVLYGVVLAAFAMYYVAAVCVFRRVIKALKLRPYHEIREARHNLNYQASQRPRPFGAVFYPSHVQPANLLRDQNLAAHIAASLR